MSGNNYPTSQTTFPVNSQFYYASNLSSNPSVAGEMPWNMNPNYNNNQDAGYWPNYQIQPSQPPLPLFPPPQQPPPPASHPPQENWYNGYSYHQQVNYPALATYQTENVMPYYFPQYPSQSSVPHTLSTSFPAFSSISQVKLSLQTSICIIITQFIFTNIKSTNLPGNAKRILCRHS